MAKIAYVTRVTIPNKVAQAEQILSMCKAFHEKFKDDFILISTSNDKSNQEKLEFNRKVIKVKNENKILKNLLFAFKTYFILKRSEIKYVYTRDVLISFISTILLKIPSCYEAHQPIRNFPSRILQLIVAKNKLYRMVTITKSLKNYYKKKFNYKNNITVIPNGACLNDYKIKKEKKEIRKELGIQIDKNIIVHTGSLYQNRGFEKFKTILKNFPEIKLIQLGGNPMDIDKLKKDLNQYNNIKFIEYQTKEVVAKYQLAADILLYITSEKSPIYWCTSPNKIFEYMASKNPILAPKIGSIPEILNISNSFLFDIDNDDDLLKKIKAIISSNNSKLTENAYNEFITKYNMSARVNKICEIFLNN